MLTGIWGEDGLPGDEGWLRRHSKTVYTVSASQQASHGMRFLDRRKAIHVVMGLSTNF
jgi:hypothetical protein